MAAATPPPAPPMGREGRKPRSGPPSLLRGGGWGERFLVAFVAGVLVVPLFAHGCHGDDIDHEPGVVPGRLEPHRTNPN